MPKNYLIQKTVIPDGWVPKPVDKTQASRTWLSNFIFWYCNTKKGSYHKDFIKTNIKLI